MVDSIVENIAYFEEKLGRKYTISKEKVKSMFPKEKYSLATNGLIAEVKAMVEGTDYFKKKNGFL